MRWPILIGLGAVAVLALRRKTPVPKLSRLEMPTTATSDTASDWRHWDRLDSEAVAKFVHANQQRMLAARVGDTAGAARWQAEYDLWFERHRQYRNTALRLRGPG